MQSETSVSLSKVSPTQLPTSSVQGVAVLMAQTAAYFPHQTIVPATSKVWLARWMELTKTYGLEIFEAALSKVVHESEFIPMPAKIEAQCKRLHGDKINRDAQERRTRECEQWRKHREDHPEEYIHLATDPDIIAMRERIDPKYKAARERTKADSVQHGDDIMPRGKRERIQ